MKTADLTGAALDWAVAKCWGTVALVNGLPWLVTGGLRYVQQRPFNPTTNWTQGGPIIERENISITGTNFEWWSCDSGCYAHIGDLYVHGDTPLIAAMRCYVASKLGDTIDIPSEIL